MRGWLSWALSISGCVALLLTVARGGDFPRSERQSGYDMMAPSTRALQDDEFTNPGALWLLDGEALWEAKVGPQKRACADCHGDARQSMRGVAARHPTFDVQRKRAFNLEGRIDICRTEQQSMPALGYEAKEMLALTMMVAAQSKGMPIESDHKALSQDIERGRRMFKTRQGQLDLSCAQCHDDNWGKKLGGNTIPQAHPTGYPQYRLEWQTVGSLHRRLRNCLTGMRAETLDAGSAELIALESYLMSRAEGMAIESPAVRP